VTGGPWTIRLALALVLAIHNRAQAQAPDPEDLLFSHRFHLQRAGAQCLDCHGAALTSASATDSNLPREKTCLVCHDGVRARKQCEVCHQDPRKARALTVVHRDIRFNHRLHLGMGNIAPVLAAAIDSGKYLGPPGHHRPSLNATNPCVSCHRGLEETDHAGKANLPLMPDCLVCHHQIQPPFSCEKCHTNPAALKPATHTPMYLEQHATSKGGLDKTSCRPCHGVEVRCMGCH